MRNATSGSRPCSFPSTLAARSLARSIALENRLAVPRAMTDEALVRIAGATMKVRMPSGLVARGSITLHLPCWEPWPLCDGPDHATIDTERCSVGGRGEWAAHIDDHR